jgi:hypothetical protein
MTTIMAMFSGYNSKITPIVHFKAVARVFEATDKDGKTIIMLPADFMTWNKRLANGLSSTNSDTNNSQEIWITGTASPLAEKNLSIAGWQLKQKTAKKLGFKKAKNVNNIKK